MLTFFLFFARFLPALPISLFLLFSGGYNLKVGDSQIELMKFDCGGFIMFLFFFLWLFLVLGFSWSFILKIGLAAVLGCAKAIAQIQPSVALLFLFLNSFLFTF
jgi:hypothetical protein